MQCKKMYYAKRLDLFHSQRDYSKLDVICRNIDSFHKSRKAEKNIIVLG